MEKELNILTNRHGLLSEKQSLLLIQYIDEIFKINKRQNLISRKLTREKLFKQCFLPAIFALPYFKNSSKVLDIGSGSGLPGIILAIVYPNISFLLVEKKHKKADFLYYIKEKLNLNNISIQNINIESLSQDLKFDTITSQAVTNIAEILKFSIKNLDKSGQILLFKGKREVILNEIQLINNTWKNMEIKLIDLFEFYQYNNFSNIENNLVIIKSKFS